MSKMKIEEIEKMAETEYPTNFEKRPLKKHINKSDQKIWIKGFQSCQELLEIEIADLKSKNTFLIDQHCKDQNIKIELREQLSCQELNEKQPNIIKYIQWLDIWNDEICFETSKDNCDEKTKWLIERFQDESDDMDLIMEECQALNNNLIFRFAESGGQNESDTQGWSRDYAFTVDSDFLIIKAEYSQG